MRLVLLQPPVYVVVVVLLRPEHPREGLAVHAALVLVQRARRNALVELVGIEQALPERLRELRSKLRARRPGGEPQLEDLAATGRHLDHVARGGLGPGLARIYRVALPGDH